LGVYSRSISSVVFLRELTSIAPDMPVLVVEWDLCFALGVLLGLVD